MLLTGQGFPHAIRRLGSHLLQAMFLLLLATGCGRALYALPDPPPDEEWTELGATATEDRQAATDRMLAAKRSAVSVYVALKGQKWDEALKLMSQDTRNFLDDASGGEGPEAALAKGELILGGQAASIRPADDFFIENMQEVRDDHPNAPAESETKNRKELYAIGRDGRARKIVMIFEADTWRLHSPFLGTPLIDASK